MRRTLVLLMVAAAVAGCTALPQQQSDDGPDVVEVAGPDCYIGEERCSSVDATKYSGDAEISLAVSNNGETPMWVDVGANGRDVMVSTCNREIASFRSDDDGGFTLEVEGPAGVDTPDPTSPVRLNPGETMRATWLMNIIPGGGDVSRLGYACRMRFQLTFNQTLESSRQIQLKEDQSVPDVTSLDTTTTSMRPVRLVIDAPESFVPATTAGSSKSLVTRAYLRNVGSGEVTDILSIDPQDEGVLAGATCQPSDDQQLRMYGEGERSGESYRRICTVDSGTITANHLNSASTIAWVRYRAEYRYKMGLGTKAISIVPVEGE